MSKLFAILFSTLICIQSFNISLEDLSKLAVLLEHAQFHKDKYDDSFLDFLGAHYGNDYSNESSNHQEHDDLPFKDSHQSCSHLTEPFTFNAFKLNLGFQPQVEIPFDFFYKELNSLFEKSNIFQPPQLT